MIDALFPLLIAFVIITLLLGFVTLIGHGLWVMFAAILRALFGIGKRPDGDGVRCPECRHPSSLLQNGHCLNCGFHTTNARRAKLQDALRLLRRLHDEGEFDDEAFGHVVHALKKEADKLAAPAGIDMRYRSTIEPTVPSAAPQQGTPFVPSQASTPEPATEPSEVSFDEPETVAPTAATPEPDEIPDVEILDAEIVYPEPVEERAPAPRAPAQPAPAPHPLDAPEPEPAAMPQGAPAFSPRQTMANMLQSFMEEKNIRWGELASGMLIVGSAIGLVLSLDEQLRNLSERIPYFPALLLMLGTIAIHLAGLYTLRRWKLRTTSRGALVIAILLVPLSFAAGLRFSAAGGELPDFGSPFYLLAVVVGLAGYGTITSFSARALFPEGWWRLTLAVMGTAAGQLFIYRLSMSYRLADPVQLLGEPATTRLLIATGLFALPLISFLVANASQLRVISKKVHLTPVRATQTFTLLGIAAFSLAIPLALQSGILSWRPEKSASAAFGMLKALSPSLTIAAAVVLSIGVAVQRRCESRAMGDSRMVGTALALLGGMLMLGTALTAWPDPNLLTSVAVVSAIILGALAVLGRLPILHAGAVAAISLAMLLVFHLATGAFDNETGLRGLDLVAVIVMGRSSLVLMVPVLASALAGILLYRGRFQQEGLVYLASAGGVAAVSTAIALYAGFISDVDANWTTIIFVTYAVVAMAVVPIVRRPIASWIAAGTLLLATVHLLRFNSLLEGPWGSWDVTGGQRLLMALLAHGLISAIFGLALRVWNGAVESENTAEHLPLNWLSVLPLAGTCVAALTIPFILYVGPADLGLHAAFAATVAVIWAITAYILWEPRLVTAAQTAATVAIAFATAAIAHGVESWQGLADIRHWQLQLSVLGIWCLLGAVGRLFASRSARARELLQPPWPAVDQVVLGGLIVGLLSVGAALCMPGISVELGFLNPETSGNVAVWRDATSGPGCWIALACILAALAIAHYERVTPFRIAGLVAALAASTLLISSHFADTNSVASTLRWSSSAFGILGTLVVAFRQPVQRAIAEFMPSAREPEPLVARVARDTVLWFATVPVLLLTTLALGQLAQGDILNGPAAESWLGGLTLHALYIVPVTILILAMLMAAARDGSALLAFVSSLLLQFLVVLAVTIEPASKQLRWTPELQLTLLQWMACSLSAYTLVWLALSRWVDRHEAEGNNVLFLIQLAAAMLGTITMAVLACGSIFIYPDTTRVITDQFGNWPSCWPSYLAAVLASAASCWFFRHDRPTLATLAVAIPAVFVILGAASTATAYPWAAYYAITCGFLLIALAVAAVCWHQRQDAEQQTWLINLRRSASSLAVVAFLFLLRGCEEDLPQAAWWTVGMSTLLFAYLAVMAIVRQRQIYAYLSAGVGCFATTVAWYHWSPAHDGSHLLFWNIMTCSLIGVFWLMLEIGHLSRHGTSLTPRSPIAPVHIFLAIVGTLIMLVYVGGGSAISILTDPPRPRPELWLADGWGLAAFGAMTLLLVALLWEQRIGLTLLATYLFGFVGIAMGLNLIQHSAVIGIGETSNRWLLVLAGLFIATYIAATGHLWRWGANLARQARKLQIPAPVAKLEYISRWLPAFNVIGTLVITGLGFIVIFALQEREMRVAMAFAPLLLAYGMSCLAQQYRRFVMQCMALILVVVGVVFIGWADITQSRWNDLAVSNGDLRAVAMFLAYAARLLIVLAGMTLLYSMGMVRWVRTGSDWLDAVKRSGAFLAVGTVITLALVLVLEAMWLLSTDTGAPIGMLEVIVISVMLFGFLVALLVMAVLPGRDPLSLSEKGRQGYVYGAQAMGALLFAHIYLARPDLFQLGILDYWPYIVMLIAFASVAFAEFCHRKNWTVIAEPMLRTGGFLPLLPALTAWAFFNPQEDSTYALALFFAGLVYVFLSISRRSFLAGMAAAVMGNGALWAWLHGAGEWSLVETPQLWLIPPAVSVLGASYINRERLSDNTLTAIRYICVMIIYLSSTGEMFMKLMEAGSDVTVESWLRPLILTCLSVAGIFAGIVFRVRAFLYLGTSFLLMSIVGMVANARLAAGHVWPWWAFGISMGIFILVLFGLFEKHRQEVRQLITRLRQWEP